MSQVIQILKAKDKSETTMYWIQAIFINIIISCVENYSVKLSSDSFLIHSVTQQPYTDYLPYASRRHQIYNIPPMWCQKLLISFSISFVFHCLFASHTICISKLKLSTITEIRIMYKNKTYWTPYFKSCFMILSE